MTQTPAETDLDQLVYTSRANVPFRDDALLSLLKRARRYHAEKGTTGGADGPRRPFRAASGGA